MPSGSPSLSVVIPCWNDAEALATVLALVSRLSGITEIIVADASADARCPTISRDFGARVAVCPAPNRGRQMNTGAAVATGDLLLFHHADTVLTQFHVDALIRAMRDGRSVGGAFHRHFDARHPWLRWAEPIGRTMAARGGTLYGDQSIFIRRETFEQMGGFADMPLMEDIEFSRRLRRAGRVLVLDPPIASSSRRHDQRGAWKTTIQNGALILCYKLGVSPARLHRWYYGPPAPAPEPLVAEATP